MGWQQIDKTDLPADKPIEVYGIHHRRAVQIDTFDMETLVGALEWLKGEVSDTPARLSEVIVQWVVIGDPNAIPPIVQLVCDWVPQRTG